MLTPVERVLILKNIDLLQGVGPRDLAVLAGVAREVEIWEGEKIYEDKDPADALYVVVQGKVRISTGDRVLSEVGSGEAFGTWSLVDDSARGHQAVCIEDGIVLALEREEFYEVAADNTALLRELLRVLARRLRKLVEERPEEARVEGEGIDKSEQAAKETPAPLPAQPMSPGASLEAAVLDRPSPAAPDQTKEATSSEPE
jgi:CRP-like cAMP-binding protein